MQMHSKLLDIFLGTCLVINLIPVAIVHFNGEGSETKKEQTQTKLRQRSVATAICARCNM